MKHIIIATLAEDVRRQLADAPAHMMGQLPLDLDGLRRGILPLANSSAIG